MKSKKRNFLVSAILILLQVCLFGLQSRCAVHSPLLEKEYAYPGAVAVFGTFRVEGAKEARWFESLIHYVSLLREPMISQVFAEFALPKGNARHDFTWYLMPGKYIIHGYHWFADMGVFGSTTATVRVEAEFEVPRTTTSVYIGTLEINPTGKAQPLIRDDMLIRLTPNDPMGGLGGTARPPMPTTSCVLRSQPDKHERRIRYGSKTEGEFTGGTDCADQGINACGGCAMKLFGVLLSSLLLTANGCIAFLDRNGLKPVEPAQSDAMLRFWVGAESPVNVDGLQPTFRWQNSSAAGVTYDFIIYQAVKRQTAKGLNLGQYAEHGKVVYSRERLNSSEHKIETPLKAGNDYLWTVRTREGDKMSEWASYTLEKWPLIGAIGRYRRPNQYFYIHTPGE